MTDVDHIVKTYAFKDNHASGGNQTKVPSFEFNHTQEREDYGGDCNDCVEGHKDIAGRHSQHEEADNHAEGHALDGVCEERLFGTEPSKVVICGHEHLTSGEALDQCKRLVEHVLRLLEGDGLEVTTVHSGVHVVEAAVHEADAIAINIV